MPVDLQLFLLKLIPLIFVFCFGACIGSLMNVLVYRLPLGMGVVTQPSHCPKCNTRLSWRENIPVLGWLLLRGKCRFCKARISLEYPLVEFAVAVMFVLVWLQLYWIPGGNGLLAQFAPDWARSGWEMTWPIYAIVVLLFSGLLASTIIDARTFTIPLQIPWAVTVIGVVVHTAWAAVVQWRWGSLTSAAPGSHWSISTPHAWPFPSSLLGVPADVDTSGIWWWIGVAIGGMAGLGLSCLMLKLGWIRRSMDDYEQWEEAELARQAAVAADPAAKQDPNRVPIDSETGLPADPTQLWTLYPRARREMVKELAFLAPIVVCACLLGMLLFKLNYTPLPPLSVEQIQAAAAQGLTTFRWSQTAYLPPFWLIVLSGSLLGYLIVGGVLWFVRIAGTLGFGKEAMGMGDVHLMAAVGACLGWIDGTLAFFLSAPVALGGWVVGWAIARLGGSKKGTTLPFGPWLSIATVLVFVLKPLIELGLTALVNAKPPVNLP
ncbi:MAG: prepilin peptidase [Phycisphaerales bacterium]|nr:prepilin peptidase [Phycisphaerales bacterium]